MSAQIGEVENYKQGKGASAKPAGKTTRRSRKKKASDAPAPAAEAAASEEAKAE